MKKQPNFGMVAQGKTRWCSRCAKGHPGAVNITGKKCEDCHQKHASCGMPSDRKRRWCGGCAKLHIGAIDISSQKCEDCKLKQPSYGMLGSKATWCAGCAKKHAGSIDIKSKRCEGCKLKQVGPKAHYSRKIIVCAHALSRGGLRSRTLACRRRVPHAGAQSARSYTPALSTSAPPSAKTAAAAAQRSAYPPRCASISAPLWTAPSRW